MPPSVRAGGTAAPSACVIPAAGASVRFHGFPKACLPVGGEAAVRRRVRLAIDAGCSPVIVVAGPHEPEVRRAVEGVAALVVPNPRWPLGRTGSIQIALDHVPEVDDVLIWPVDHMFVHPQSARTLLAARERDALALWFIPMYFGQGGHPILLRRAAVPAVRALDPGASLRAVLPHLGPQVARIPVPDPGVIANADTPEEYDYYLSQWRDRWTVD